MVLFVYGYCDQRDCFYCPLGENRKNVTQTYANERPVESDEDVISEAKKMDALGSSITGGEPQEALDRTCHYLELLKEEFGEDHHTHLYTGIPGGRENMRRLSEAGLDEIRFHPPYEQWGDLHGTEWEEILYIAREEGLTPAFEIPGIRAETEFLDFLDEGAAEGVELAGQERPLDEAEGGDGVRELPVSLSAVPVETYRALFFHSVLIQGFGAGLLAGKLADNRTLSGLKYSIALTALSVGVFLLI